MGVELQAEAEQDVSVVLSTPDPAQQAPSQPAHQPAEIKLDKQEVRQAMRAAAEKGIDPFSLSVGDLQEKIEPPKKQAEVEQPLDVPEKFKKPNGEVDVEKLQASTEQLDKAIQEKSHKLQDVNKFVEEQVKAYKEKYKQFRAMPNPEKVQAKTPVPSVENPDQLRARVMEDLKNNPIEAIMELADIIAERKVDAIRGEIEPFKEERFDNSLRGNLKTLAEKDPRVVEHIAEINAKLDEHPEMRALKNPHKAAWLEVKEDLRLGEFPSNGTPAHPSKPPTPILGGGTPPPAPASSGEVNQDAIFAAASLIGRDPRTQKYDPKAREALNQAAKKFFDDMDRKARRF